MHLESYLGTPWGARYDQIKIKTEIIRVISLEDDLLPGYQCRNRIVFGLSASKMSCFWAISVEADLRLGYQRRI